jgi:hypothetical protein
MPWVCVQLSVEKTAIEADRAKITTPIQRQIFRYIHGSFSIVFLRIKEGDPLRLNCHGLKMTK